MAFAQSDHRRALVRKAVYKLRNTRRALAVAYLGGCAPDAAARIGWSSTTRPATRK